MPKDFDKWNTQKKKVHGRAEQILFHEREIWWCSLGINIGVETDGKNDNFERPILVLKKFNKDMVWVVPITSRKGPVKYYYPIKYGNKDLRTYFPIGEPVFKKRNPAIKRGISEAEAIMFVV